MEKAVSFSGGMPIIYVYKRTLNQGDSPMIIRLIKAILGTDSKKTTVKTWPTAENANKSWGTSGYDRHFVR